MKEKSFTSARRLLMERRRILRKNPKKLRERPFLYIKQKSSLLRPGSERGEGDSTGKEKGPLLLLGGRRLKKEAGFSPILGKATKGGGHEVKSRGSRRRLSFAKEGL